MAEPSTNKKYLDSEGVKRLYEVLKQELSLKLEKVDLEDIQQAIQELNEAISTKDISDLEQAETIIIYGGSASDVII